MKYNFFNHVGFGSARAGLPPAVKSSGGQSGWLGQWIRWFSIRVRYCVVAPFFILSGQILYAAPPPTNCCVIEFDSGYRVPGVFVENRQGSYGSYTLGVCKARICLNCESIRMGSRVSIGVGVNISCVTNLSYPLCPTIEGEAAKGWTLDCYTNEAGGLLRLTASPGEVSAGTISACVVAQDSTKYCGDVEIIKEDECETCSGGSCPDDTGGENSSSPPGTSPLGSTSTANSSVAVSLALGRCAFGKNAGALAMKELYPTNLLSTPGCLAYKYKTNSECEIITASCGIRQVKVPEGLANIVTNTAYKYSIEVYHPSAIGAKYTNSECTGCYTNTGPPLVTTIVENPDTTGNTTNRLKVTDGWGTVSEYEWKTSGWELVKGGGRYKKTRTTVWSSGNTFRTNIVELRNDTNGMVSCESRTYQVFPFGTNLVTAVTGEGTAALTNTFAYYTNTAHLTGVLHQITYGTGGWELYEYHTNRLKTNACFAFLNQAPTSSSSLCRSLSCFYPSNSVFGTNILAGSGDDGQRRRPSPRCIVERVLGHEVARTYNVFLHAERRDIQCVNPGAAWNDPSNLVTIVKWYDSGDATNYGRYRSIERPDGTMDLFSYTFGTSGGSSYRTNTILSGAPNGSKTDITDGERTVEVVGPVGQMVSHTVIDISSGITVSQVLYTNYDSFNRPRTMKYLDGTSHWTDHGCCGAITETNREGTTLFHYLDNLQRRAATKQNNITHTNVIDAAGNLLRRVRIGSDASQITQASYKYDSGRRRTASTNALNQATIVSETITDNQLVRTTTYPDGGTRVETYYRDGQLAKVTGTAVHPVGYDYGVENDGNGKTNYFTKEIKLDGNGNDTSEWTKTYRDMVGRSYMTVYADGAASESFYNIKGQLVKQVDPDGVTTLYAYNAEGEQTLTATDVDRDGVIDYDGTDRIRQTASATANVSSQDVRQSKSYAWATNNSAISNLVSESRRSTDGLQSWTIHQSQLTNQSRTKYSGSGNRYVTNTAPDGSFSVSHFAHGLLQSVTRKDALNNQLSSINYFYDAHGRQNASTDARNGTSYLSYNNADRVVSTVSPAPGNGQSPQTTSYEHDWVGRVTRTVLPDGTCVTNEYHLTGELKKTYGSRNYPVQYGYDAQGRRTNMITWKNFAADSGKATTTWKYDPNRGFMISKAYDDGKGTTNTYTPAGRLRTRTWARGIVTTYLTNAIGEVFATTYSDSTPAVTNNLDRLGRSTNIVDGAGSRFLVYSSTGQLLSETNASGSLIGANLRFSYDQYFRRTNHSWYATNTSLLSHSFAFDGASRITNASDGTYQAGYSYLANSPLISQIQYRSNSTARMTTTKSFDFLNRLTSIASVGTGSTPSVDSYAYAYNDANQRTRVNLADGSFWIYEYDKLGQVISGKRYWNDWTPVAGQQYEYAFDDIGNRSSTKAGGDANGADLRTSLFSANALNQYTSHYVPPYLNVLGIAHANASVTVNSQSPYRRGEYFWKELSVDNSSAAIWQSITNIASLTGTNQTNTGNLFLTKSPEDPLLFYDADGNLTSDGRWTNRWDAENRLIDMTSHSSGPSGSRKSLQFAYDSQGRRYSKVVSNWTGSAWTRALHEKYLYDGWNLLGALDGTNNAIIRSFLWGLDLSGSVQGAGGVGGLICFKQHSGSAAGSHFAAYDGNGNVMALVDGKTGNTSARYEYDPFGQTIRASGTMAVLNPVRFSSKPVDDETDLAYYGYRYLNPNTGRWLNRDPIGERGDLNMYTLARNSPVMRFDALGLKCPDREVYYGGDPTVTEMRTKEECGQTCGSRTDAAGQPDLTRPIPACARTSISHTESCCHMTCGDWIINYNIRLTCTVMIAAEGLGAQFTPSRDAAIAHEKCHCDDYRTLVANIVADLRAAGSFASRSSCEAKLAEINVQRRIDNYRKTDPHLESKYDEGGSCYATGDF